LEVIEVDGEGMTGMEYFYEDQTALRP
jgi:hypothetical protein